MTASALSGRCPGGRPRRELVPGAVHVPSWLTPEQQRWIVGRFGEWTRGPVPIRAAKVRGHAMSVRTVCLGWHWQPYQYTHEATDVNGRRVLPFPEWMVRLGRLALAAAAGDPSAGDGYTPDAALVNYYDADARLGMHLDKEER
jgi:alkylated DNA repair protein (DNA oxidative demethylase)